MRAEGRRRAHDGTEVARVGDVVERHDQRRLAGVGGTLEQVVGVRVLVRRHLQDQPLVGSPSASRSSSMRGASSTGSDCSFARSTAWRTRSSVSIRSRRTAPSPGICAVSASTTAVAADDVLRTHPLAERPRPDDGRLPRLALGALGRRPGSASRGVLVALGRLGRRAPPLQLLATLAAAADRRPLLALCASRLCARSCRPSVLLEQ